MAKGKKPIPKSQKEISQDLQSTYSPPESNGNVLSNPNDSEYDSDLRGNHKSFKGDKVKPFSISIGDLDEAIIYYLTNIIKPTVYQGNKKINVPILYGNPERWKQIQKDGYLRDKSNQILLPLIVLTRTNLEPNRLLTNKLDSNNPHNYNIFTKQYSKKNSYDNFSVLTNRIPEKEMYSIVVPDYVTLTYDFIITTHFVEQMNEIIEAINYASDSYWGNPERFKFKAIIDSFPSQIELPADGQRLVKTTFTLKLHGYIVPDTYQKDLHSVKKFNNKTQMIFGMEIVESFDDLVQQQSSPSFGQSNTAFPGNNSCAPVLIYRNGILYQTIESGGSFSYETGSGGNPIDLYINSQSFLTDQTSDIYLPVKNRLGVGVGSDEFPDYVIENSTITVNNTYYTAAAAEYSANVSVVNTNNTNVGFVSGAYFRIRDVYNSFNFTQITGARAETSKSIEVIDEFNGDPIGDKITDSYTNLTVRIKNAHVSNSNGTYSASILPGTTGSIRNTYVNISNSLNTTIYSTSIPSGVTNSFYISGSPIYINSSSLQTIPASSSLYIELVNTISSSVGDIVSTSKVQVRNVYVSNSNNTYSASIPAQTSASLPNTYINVYNGLGTLVQTSSLASCTTGSITLTSSIAYIRPPHTGVSASFLAYDDYWFQINRPDPYTASVNSIPAYLDSVYPYMLRNNNVFGHKWRMTGISGGYYDIDTAQYKLVDGTVSDQATTFGTAAGNTSYLIDHHTGLGWKWNINGSRIWATHASASVSSSHAGFSDWYLPNINELMSLQYYTQIQSVIYLPFNGNTFKSSTPYIAFETTQHLIKNNQFSANQADATSNFTTYVRRHFT